MMRQALRTLPARTHARAFSSEGVVGNTRAFLQNIFDPQTMPKVPLNEHFTLNPKKGLDIPATLDKEAQISTLENGLRVASLDQGSSLASVGVFIDAGSRYETHETNGISHFFEQLAFKSTKNRSEFRLIREMLKIGANVMATSSREHMIYTADVLRERVPEAIGTFGDVIQHHAFDPQEVAQGLEAYAQEIEDRAHQPDLLVMEAIQEAAYHNNTVGLSLYAPSNNLQNFTPELLQEYATAFFSPSRMVVAGVGVGHDELVALTKETFTALPADNPNLAHKQPAQYTGGDVRMHQRGDEQAHFVLAFETAHWHHADLIPMCVLQLLMGGGGSFSAGGPGKGMCSRLYEQVLNQHGWVESASSFNLIHSDTALFGLYGTCHPQHAGQLVEVFTKQATGMTGSLSDLELQRAKNALKSTVLMQLEQRPSVLEDIGRQVIAYNKVTDGVEICKQIDAVTAKDIQRVAADMLKTKPSVAAYGDLSFLPRYEEITKQFK